jgi:hypothetical protein
MEIFWHSKTAREMFGHPWFHANIPGQSAEEPSGFIHFNDAFSLETMDLSCMYSKAVTVNIGLEDRHESRHAISNT